MATFQYTAVNKEGSRIQGQIDANGEAELRLYLRQQNLRPVKISKVEGGGKGKETPDGKAQSISFPFFGVRDDDVLLFTRQLAILITSGIPLVQGLEIVGAQISSVTMKNIVLGIKDRVSGGAFLYEAMASYPQAFSGLYVSMIKAGESSGSLDVILKRLMRYLEDAIKLKKLARSAMIYPAVVSIVGVGVLLIMMMFVIPKFEEMLQMNNQELPAITQFVIDTSHFLINRAPLIFGGMAALFFLVIRYASTQEGRTFFDLVVLRLPIFGPLVQKICVARFSRTMQTMLSSGINLLDSIEICKGAVGNVTYAKELGLLKSQVETGKTMSGTLREMPLFPSMMTQMVTVGETTGNMDQMLERVADFYEEEVTNAVSNMTKLIEPIILVVLGGAVAGLMVAMYLPIFKLAG